MSLFKFEKDDVIYSRVKTFPKSTFYVYGGKTYYNGKADVSGSFRHPLDQAGPAGVNVHELNIDRPAGDTVIYPYITKQGSLTSFKTISKTSFNTDFKYGDTVNGSYPISASIRRIYYAEDSTPRAYIKALRTTIGYYSYMSSEFEYNNANRDFDTVETNFIDIPSIFYGSSINKGSMNLKFYVAGDLVGHLRDEKRNGELIQVGPESSARSGSTAGIIFYNEGIVLLTGSWSLDEAHTETYNDASVNPAWIYFGYGCDEVIAPPLALSSSFEVSFEGVNVIPTITMNVHAKKGELTYSNNPTFTEYGQTRTALTSSNYYKEPDDISIKNIVSSSFDFHSASYVNMIYISKIGIYDEHRNLIGIAKLATPLKKTPDRDYTIKLKLDV